MENNKEHKNGTNRYRKKKKPCNKEKKGTRKQRKMKNNK